MGSSEIFCIASHNRSNSHCIPLTPLELVFRCLFTLLSRMCDRCNIKSNEMPAHPLNLYNCPLTSNGKMYNCASNAYVNILSSLGKICAKFDAVLLRKWSMSRYMSFWGPTDDFYWCKFLTSNQKRKKKQINNIIVAFYRCVAALFC